MFIMHHHMREKMISPQGRQDIQASSELDALEEEEQLLDRLLGRREEERRLVVRVA